MRDDEDRAAFHERVHTALDERFGSGVDRGRRFVENHDRGVGDGGAGNGKKLPLALREVRTVCVQHRVVALGKTGDEVVGVGKLRRRDAFLIGCIQLAVADVLHDGSCEEVHVLKHDAERVAEVRLFDVVDVDAVISNLAVGDVIKPVNEVCDRSFACAGRADEGELLAGLGVKGHVMKHLLIRHIAKVYVKEANVALEQTVFHRAVVLPALPGPFARALGAGDDRAVFLAAARKRDGSFVTLGLLIEKLKDTSRARNGHCDGVHLLGDLRDIRRELLAHAEVRRDNGDRKGRNERSVHHEILDGDIRNRAAERHEEAACERGEHVQKVTDVVHDRHEDICKAVCLARIGKELVVELVKIGLRGLLMAEDLDDFLAVHHFLDEALGLAERVLLADEVFGGFAADVLGRKRHADDAENHNDHQRHAVIEHHAHNADDSKS